MEQTKKKKESLVMLGAKVPADIREIIERKAEKEDRSLSKVVSRLLASHPELKKERQLAMQA